MSEVEHYISQRRVYDSTFSAGFETGYRDFEIGVLLKQAREDAGLTQQELADMVGTRKSAISRLENHAEDIKLSTIRKVTDALGRRLELTLR